MSCGLFDDYIDEPTHVELTKEDKKLLDKYRK